MICRRLLATLVVFAWLPLVSSCDVEDLASDEAVRRTKATVEMVCSSIRLYQEDHRSLPSLKVDLEGVIKLPSQEKMSSSLADGWNRRLQPVISNGAIIGAYSFGPNGIGEDGAGDDIGCRVTEGK